MSGSFSFSKKSKKVTKDTDNGDAGNNPERNIETPEDGRRRRAAKTNPILNAQTDNYADDSDIYKPRTSRMQRLEYFGQLLKNKGKRPLPFGFRSWRTKEIAEKNELSMYPIIYSLPFRIAIHNYWDQLFLNMLIIEIILLVVFLDGWAELYAPMLISLNAGNQLLILPPLIMFITQLIPFLAAIYYTSHCNDLVHYLGVKNFQAWAFAAVLTTQYVEYFYYSGQGKRHLAGECRYGHIRHPGRIQRLLSYMYSTYYIKRMKKDARISPEDDDDDGNGSDSDSDNGDEASGSGGSAYDLGAAEEGRAGKGGDEGDDGSGDGDGSTKSKSDGSQGSGDDGYGAGAGNTNRGGGGKAPAGGGGKRASPPAPATAAPPALSKSGKAVAGSAKSVKKSVRIADAPLGPVSAESEIEKEKPVGPGVIRNQHGDEEKAGNDDNDNEDDEKKDGDDEDDKEEDDEEDEDEGEGSDSADKTKKDKKKEKLRRKKELKRLKKEKKEQRRKAREAAAVVVEEPDPIEYMEWTCIVCSKFNKLPRHPEVGADVIFGESGVYYKRMYAQIQHRRDMPTCVKCHTYADYNPPEGTAHLFPHNPNPHAAFENYPPSIEIHSGLKIDKLSIYTNHVKSFLFGLRNSMESKVMKNDWRLRKFVMDRFPEVPKQKLQPGESYELGEIIECRQQKFEWTRARIIQVRTNRTYDIRYDYGDEIRFVSESAIRMRPEKRRYAYRVELGMVFILMLSPLGLALGFMSNNPGMVMLGPLVVSALLLANRVVVGIQTMYNYYDAGLWVILRLSGLYALPLLFLLIGSALGMTAGLDPAAWATVGVMFLLAQVLSLPALYMMRPPFAVFGALHFIQASMGFILVPMQFSNPAALTYYGIAFAPFLTMALCLKYIRRNLHNIWDTCIIIRPALDTSKDNPSILLKLWDGIVECFDCSYFY